MKLYHRQVYEYAYHRPKLALLAQGAEHARFTGGLASFLEAVPKTCPHDLFTASVRASQTAADFIDRTRLTAQGKGELRHPHGGAHHSRRRQQLSAPRKTAALHACQ